MGVRIKFHRRTKCTQVTTLRTSITEWRQLTCTATGVPAEPSTHPAGRVSSGAPPGSDWSSPRSRPKNRKRGGRGRATCYSRGVDVYKSESVTPLMWESIFPQVQHWLRLELPALDPNYSQTQQQQLCNTIYRGRGGGTKCQQCSTTGTHPVSRLYVFVLIGQKFFNCCSNFSSWLRNVEAEEASGPNMKGSGTETVCQQDYNSIKSLIASLWKLCQHCLYCRRCRNLVPVGEDLKKWGKKVWKIKNVLFVLFLTFCSLNRAQSFNTSPTK